MPPPSPLFRENVAGMTRGVEGEGKNVGGACRTATKRQVASTDLDRVGINECDVLKMLSRDP